MYLRTSDKPGRMLERLVAALHGAAGEDMQVTWNERIGDGPERDTARLACHEWQTVNR